MKKMLRCSDCTTTAEIEVDYNNLELESKNARDEGESVKTGSEWIECVEEGNGIYLCNDGKYRCEACEKRYEEGLVAEAKFREQSLELKDMVKKLRERFPKSGEFTVLLSGEVEEATATGSGRVLLIRKDTPREALRMSIARAYFTATLSLEDRLRLESKVTNFLGSKDLGERYVSLIRNAILENASHRFWGEPLPKERFSNANHENAGLLITLVEVLLNDEVPEHVVYHRPFFENLLSASPNVNKMQEAVHRIISEASETTHRV